MKVGRALISVSDKAGVADFATALVGLGIEIVSTGGSAAALREAGLTVTEVSEVTGFPEMMDGRVKTLHPFVHGGILADRSNPEHMASLHDAGIKPIDLVAVNLYPFAQTVARPGVGTSAAVENIDIGGPTLIRAAAKNFGSVGIVVDPADYPLVLGELKANGELTITMRSRLMAKAFAHTAAYDSRIAAWFGAKFDPEYPLAQSLTLSYARAQTMRYGENPHQRAALYRDESETAPSIANAAQRWGKELSYNNLLDADAAIELVREFEPPAVAIIKHSNPCGCAVGGTSAEAFVAAREADPISVFGGIVALNRPVGVVEAEAILQKGNFFEVVVAPGFSDEALRMFAGRSGWGADVRLMETGTLARANPGFALRSINGGLLYQERDTASIDLTGVNVPTARAPTDKEMSDLRFAWTVVKHVKSNAIVIAEAGRLRGVGAGQMNRVQSVHLALAQAGDRAHGAALASDAFFPFADSIEAAGAAGITAVIQPGGSKKDVDSITACDRLGIAMVFTGMRHFRH